MVSKRTSSTSSQVELRTLEDSFLRLKAVHQAVGLSRTTIWRLEKDGKFPARRKLSSNSVGWLKSSIEAWIQSRAAVVGGLNHG